MQHKNSKQKTTEILPPNLLKNMKNENLNGIWAVYGRLHTHTLTHLPQATTVTLVCAGEAY